MDDRPVTCPDRSSRKRWDDKKGRGHNRCYGIEQPKIDHCIMIKGTCCDRPINCFIDTGSSVSIISQTFLKHIKKENEMKTCNLKLKAFSGNSVKIYGQVTLPAELVGVKMDHEFVVADFHEAEILMGMDIVSKYGIIIDASRKRVISDDSAMEFRNPPKPISTGVKIVCDKTFTIKPFSGAHISGKLVGKGSKSLDLYGQMEPYYNTMIATGIMTAHSLVNSKDGIIPIRVINTTDKPIKLRKRTLMGQMKPIDLGQRVMKVSVENDHEGDYRCDEESRLDREVHQPENGTRVWTRQTLFEELKLDELEMDESESMRLKELCWDYRSIFSTGDHDIGQCNFYEARLELKESYKPRWVPSRPIPYRHEKEMDKQIGDLIKSGVVEECHEHSNFNSPIFLVAKGAQKESWRMVCDLRQVNLEIKDESMELTNLNSILDRVGDKNLYSTMDLSKSFHQIPYSKDSRFITAFMYKGKQYHFKRMIMGCKTSSGHLTRAIMMLLSNMPIEHVAYFVDDILLFTRDVKSHIDLLSMVFERILQGGMKLTPKKCHFLREEVVYTGVTLTSEGVKINEDRIEAITKLQPPKNKPELQSVMGIFNYSKKFVKGYSDIARPLYRLLRKSNSFEWSDECRRAFDRLKMAMVTAPVLAFPDVEDPHSSYEVQLDGSKWAYGATLTQIIKGKRRVVAYFSRQIQEHKKIWPQTQLEFETLYQTLKYFKLYLKGVKQFRVITDCLPLLNITTIFSKMSTSVIRKLQELANYRFTITHVSGKENYCADALSRYGYQSYNRSAGKEEPQPKVHKLSVANKHQLTLDAVDKVRDRYYAIKYPQYLREGKLSMSRVEETTIKTHGDKNGVTQDLRENTQVESEIPAVVGDQKVGIEEQVEPIIPTYLFEDKGETPHSLRFVSTKSEHDSCNCDLVRGDHSVDRDQNGYGKHSVNTLSYSNCQNDSVPQIDHLSFNKDIKGAQKSDDIISKVIEWVQKGDKPKSIQANRCPKELLSYWKQFSLLSLEDGLLIRKWHNVKNPSENRKLIVVPDSLQEVILKKVHSDESSHAGVANTLELCRRHFYWPQMEECIKLWVAACYKCAETKPPARYAKAPLQHITFHSFNDGVVIDHIEPEKVGTTPRKYKYILTITDSWSNYLLAVPTRTQESKETISLIRRHWIDRFGMPHELMADNHPSFKSKFFKTVLAAFDCKRTHGQPYVSRTTGRAERSNRRINMAMRATLSEGCYKDWDLYLGRVVFSLNCLKNRHTGYSSNFLVFGRELNTPLSLLAEKREDFELESLESGNYDAKAWQLYKNCKEITRKVRQHAEADFCYSQRYCDKNLKGPYFEEGEEVFILIQCPKHKFGPRWVGPYKIQKKISDHLYSVLLPNGEQKVYNIRKLKKYIRNKYSPKISECPITEAKVPNNQPPPPQVVEYSDSDSDSDNDLEFVGIPRPEIQPRRTPKGKVLFPPRSHSSEHNSAAVLDRHAETAGQRAAVTSTPRVSFGDGYPRNGTPRSRMSFPGDSFMSGSQYHSLNNQDSSLSTVDLGTQNNSGEATIVQSTPTPPGRYNLREGRERRPPDRYGYGSLNLLNVSDLYHGHMMANWPDPPKNGTWV